MRLRRRLAGLVVASLAALASCLPSPPSDRELETQLASRRTDFLALVEAARSHGVSRVGADFCEPALEPTAESEIRAKMKALGVRALSVDEERETVMLVMYAWGLAVSGVVRGYYYCPDAGFDVPAPKGQRVALSRKRQVVRIDDHWLLFQGE